MSLLTPAASASLSKEMLRLAQRQELPAAEEEEEEELGAEREKEMSEEAVLERIKELVTKDKTLKEVIDQLEVETGKSASPWDVSFVSTNYKIAQMRLDSDAAASVVSHDLLQSSRDEQTSALVSALIEVISLLNVDVLGPEILDSLAVSLAEREVNMPELVGFLLARCGTVLRDVDGPSVPALAKLRDVRPLLGTDWTPQLLTRTREVCEKLLLPITSVAFVEEKKLILVRGVNVVCSSRIMKKASELKAKHGDGVEELRIVGLSAVHVDCNLDRSIWHGTNVSIVADLVSVAEGKDVVWDLSGNDPEDLGLRAAARGQNPGEDGKAGDSGTHGESGGNVRVICRVARGCSDRWTLQSSGGDGGRGQNGGDGADGRAGKDAPATPTQVDLERDFPPVASFQFPIQNFKKLLDNLKMKAPDYTFLSDFFFDDKLTDSGRVTAAFSNGILGLHQFLLIKGGLGGEGQKGGRGGRGGAGGEGGFPGSITFVSKDGSPEPQKKNFVKGKDGKNGKDGEGGLNGPCGKPAGDVGYIDAELCLSYPKYYGLDGGQKSLEINYSKEKPDRPDYVWCSHKKCWVWIEDKGFKGHSVQQSRQYLKTEAKSEKKQNTATWKKAVSESSLKQEFEQVCNHSKMTETMRASEEATEVVAAIPTFELALVHNVELQQQEHAGDAAAKVGLVKTFCAEAATPAARKTVRNIAIEGITCRCRGDPPKEPEVPEPKCRMLKAANMTGCLDRVPTGDDSDNVLHCVFGQMNDLTGVYVCKDCPDRRKFIAERVMEKSPWQHSILEQFVWGLEEEDKSEFPNSWALKNKEGVSEAGSNGEHVKAEDWLKVQKEYSDYLLSPLHTLDLLEMQLLALAYQVKIHIYGGGTEELVFVRTLNPEGDDDHFVLGCGDGIWQRLECNPRRLAFKERRADYATFYRPWAGGGGDEILGVHRVTARGDAEGVHEGEAVASPFEALLELMRSTNCDAATIKWFEKLDPEYGMVQEALHHLLLTGLSGHIIVGSFDLGYLAERVIEATTACKEDLPHIEHVVSTFCPFKWRHELLLLEMEERVQLVLPPEKREEWRKYLYAFGGDDDIVRVLRSQLAKTNITENRLGEILKFLSLKPNLTEEDLKGFGKLALHDWLFELKAKFWEKEVDDKLSNGLTKVEERREALYLILELENKKGFEYCCNLMEQTLQETRNAQSILEILQKRVMSDHLEGSVKLGNGGRSYSEIISVILVDGNTSTRVHSVLQNVSTVISNLSEETKMLLDDIEKWGKLKLASLRPTQTEEEGVEAEVIKRGLQLPDEAGLFVSLFDRLIELKMHYRLRDTQKVSIMTFLCRGDKNMVAQVSTGEGKSLIVAGVAIAWALSGMKVDVITSSSMLAVRDSKETSEHGGLRDIYEAFGIDVDNNCSATEEDHIEAYNCPVVYGELGTFQRDHLLNTFYGRNVKGDRTLDSVIVDEVDCMLLDRGSNVLFLSHDIPGMESLESLYVFIWQRVQLTLKTMAQIKSDILYDMYGAIEKNDLENIQADLTREEKNSIWAHLIKSKIIDWRGRMLLNEEMNYAARSKLNPKLVYYLQTIFRRDRMIRVPKHLLPFVDRHLDVWLQNAFLSLGLNSNEHYVVDQDRSNASPDLNPQVTIIDRGTGADQSTSQWDGSLHQFLQLKEGCRLTLQSLKAVFISNTTYFQGYRNLAGLTGTLGSQPERDFLQQTYKSEYLTVPTAFPKRFTIKPAIVRTSEEGWLEAIIEEAALTIQKEKRSILVFGSSIQQAHLLRDRLKQQPLNPDILHCYTRDYEKFPFESDKELAVGQIIVATNLAGRGTDIKLSKDLVKNGGLHVCLTYLPENVRIEEQAIGRAGRKGQNGSSILILCEESDRKEWGSGKVFDLKEERNRNELKRISQLKEDIARNSMVQEKCLRMFSKHYAGLEKQCETLGLTKEEKEVVCLSALDRWALWLDKSGGSSMEQEVMTKRLTDDLLREIKMSLDDNNNWLPSFLAWTETPARLISLSKHLAHRSKKYSDANLLLDRIINSPDESLYPSAHYYKAFVMTKEKNVQECKSEFIRELRSAETILNEHIEQQMLFSAIVSEASSAKTAGFCPIDAYKKQKENVMHLLQLYLGSISSLLGSRCSESGLMETAGLTEERAAEVWKMLKANKYVSSCMVNEAGSIPGGYNTTVQKVADNRGVSKPEIDKFMLELRNAGSWNELELEEKLKSKQLFKSTSREAFWQVLREEKVLIDVAEWIIVSQNTYDSNEKLNNVEELPEVDISKCIMFNPIYTSWDDLKEKGRVVLSKSVVKAILGDKDYQSCEKMFEFNEIAQLDLEALKKVDLSQFGKMEKNSLAQTGIAESEWTDLWDVLITQGIVKEDGNKGENEEDGNKGENEEDVFKYPACPAYEDGVKCLVQKTFTAESIRQYWLSTDIAVEGNRYARAISQLPVQQEKSLLGDLLANHVLSAPRVPDDLNMNPDGGLVGLVTERFDNMKMLFPDETERGRIVSYLKSCQATHANLENPVASLRPLREAAAGSSQREGIALELYTFGLVGFDHLLELGEKRWTRYMILKASAVVAMGLLQCAAGTAIAIYFAGTMAHASSALISEGISDIIFGASALFSGNTFSWADYGRHKLESIATTVTTMGVAMVFSRGVKYFKYGYQMVGSGLQSGEKLVHLSSSFCRQTLKGTVTKVIKSCAWEVTKGVSLGLVNQGVQALVSRHLSGFCQEVGKKICGFFHFAKDKSDSMKDLMGRLYRTVGKEEANLIIADKMRLVFTGSKDGWMAKAKLIMNAVTGSFGSGLRQAMEKRQAAGAVWNGVKMAAKICFYLQETMKHSALILHLDRIASTYTSSFKAELEKSLKEVNSSEADADEKDVNQFQDAKMDELKSALDRQAGDLVQEWTTKVLQEAAVHVIEAAGKAIKEVYMERKNSAQMRVFHQLQEMERALQQQESNQEEQQPSEKKGQSEEYVNSLLKLMKETTNPKLFAAIIREGGPADRFTADALCVALPGILKANGFSCPDGFAIRIETTDGAFVHHNVCQDDDTNILVLKLDRATLEGTGHVRGGEGGSGYDCLFEAVAKQINERLVGAGIDGVTTLNPRVLREKAANAIESDSTVSEAIRNGWHRPTLELGLHGGKAVPQIIFDHKFGIDREVEKAETGVAGIYEDMKQYSKLNVTEQDHQPASSHWKEGKDNWAKNLKKEAMPTISMSKEDHKLTENYLSKAKSSKFSMEQKRLMRKGDYAEAIYQASITNYLPVLLGQTDPAMRDKWETAMMKHFDLWATVPRSPNSKMTVITKKQSEVMKKKLKTILGYF